MHPELLCVTCPATQGNTQLLHTWGAFPGDSWSQQGKGLVEVVGVVSSRVVCVSAASADSSHAVAAAAGCCMLCRRSIKRQFESFAAGFKILCDGPAIRLFNACEVGVTATWQGASAAGPHHTAITLSLQTRRLACTLSNQCQHQHMAVSMHFHDTTCVPRMCASPCPPPPANTHTLSTHTSPPLCPPPPFRLSAWCVATPTWTLRPWSATPSMTEASAWQHPQCSGSGR